MGRHQCVDLARGVKAPQGADDGSSYDIYRIPADGGGAETFIGGPGDQYLPFWSPDGNRIAYFSDRGIWLADRDGGHRQPLEIPERSLMIEPTRESHLRSASRGLARTGGEPKATGEVPR